MGRPHMYGKWDSPSDRDYNEGVGNHVERTVCCPECGHTEDLTRFEQMAWCSGQPDHRHGYRRMIEGGSEIHAAGRLIGATPTGTRGPRSTAAPSPETPF